MITPSDLVQYVGAISDEDLAAAQHFIDTATALVDGFCGAALVPEAVLNHAYTVVAAEMFSQREAPNGIAQYADGVTTTPMRVARDPMRGAYPVLARYIGPAIA